MKRVAIFDFDGTLTINDTFIDFAIFALGKKKVISSIFKTLPQIILWKTGFKKSDFAKESLFRRLYSGLTSSYIQKIAQEYNPSLKAHVLNSLRLHQQNGDIVYIISASIDLWIVPWALRNGVENVCCTCAEISENGIITGNFSTPNCRGEEKLKRFINCEPVRESYHLTVYGDSSSDIPLLKFADIPIKI